MDLIVKYLLFLQLFITNLHLSTTENTARDLGSAHCLEHHSTIGSTFERNEICQYLDLESVNITEPTQELFDRIADGLKLLGVYRSTTDAVYLPHNLSSFQFIGKPGCTTQIIIGENDTYKLQEIGLSHLRQFPANMDRLHLLEIFACKQIYGGNIDLTVFTKTAQLREVEISDIAGVTISEPLGLPSLVRLAILNSLVTLSDEASCEFPRLEVLNLENNNLQVIPKYFSTFTSLVYFTVSRNKLRSITFDLFANMKQLEAVAISFNQISELRTESKVELPRLKALYLDNNNLTELNVTLWNMPALKILSLSSNQLKRVSGLTELCIGQVQKLLMFDNPWDCEWINGMAEQLSGVKISVSGINSCKTFGRNTN